MSNQFAFLAALLLSLPCVISRADEPADGNGWHYIASGLSGAPSCASEGSVVICYLPGQQHQLLKTVYDQRTHQWSALQDLGGAGGIPGGLSVSQSSAASADLYPNFYILSYLDANHGMVVRQAAGSGPLSAPIAVGGDLAFRPDCQSVQVSGAEHATPPFHSPTICLGNFNSEGDIYLNVRSSTEQPFAGWQKFPAKSGAIMLATGGGSLVTAAGAGRDWNIFIPTFSVNHGKRFIYSAAYEIGVGRKLDWQRAGEVSMAESSDLNCWQSLDTSLTKRCAYLSAAGVPSVATFNRDGQIQSVREYPLPLGQTALDAPGASSAWPGGQSIYVRSRENTPSGVQTRFWIFPSAI